MQATLYTADWVLPVSALPIAHGAVLVDERGVIREVDSAARITVGDDVARMDLGAAVLLPGLVNVHAHPDLAGLRGLLEDMPFHEWIPRLRRARENSGLTEEDYIDFARWSCIEFLRAGITTVGATDAGASLRALADAGMRGVVFREVFGPDPRQAATSMTLLREAVTALRAIETDLVRVGVSPHAPYTVSDELYRQVALFAVDEDLPLAAHIAESEVEMQLVTQGAGPFAAGLRTRGIETPVRARSPIELLQRTGLLRTRPLLIHCVLVDDADVDMIANSGATVAHCPVANARLGHGVAPLMRLRERGVTVGVGTDSVASNNRTDILEEARVAQIVQRATLRSAGALPAEQLLRLVTVEGARALGLDARIGTLEPGKEADLCAVRMDAVHVRPAPDPVTALFMSARASDVILTAVRGVVLYRDGRVTSLDEAALAPRIEENAARMRTASHTS